VVIRLSAHDLGCVRGGREVFEGLNFTVAAGEALAITGRNGAGKTTLLRLIAGLLELVHGRIELTGGAAEASLAEQAHYLGHRDALKPALSVLENLLFWLAFLGGTDASVGSARTALEAVDLAGLAGLPAAYLSAGQRRRLAIARLIAAPRPIWLLDEPTAALDTASQGRLAELMRSHLAGGGLIVAATHGPLGLDGVKELRLEPSPQAQSAPSPPVVGEGWGGGSLSEAIASPPAHTRTTPSPQRGGEKETP
jgi:heme exporter protein A